MHHVASRKSAVCAIILGGALVAVAACESKEQRLAVEWQEGCTAGDLRQVRETSASHMPREAACCKTRPGPQASTETRATEGAPAAASYSARPTRKGSASPKIRPRRRRSSAKAATRAKKKRACAPAKRSKTPSAACGWAFSRRREPKIPSGRPSTSKGMRRRSPARLSRARHDVSGRSRPEQGRKPRDRVLEASRRASQDGLQRPDQTRLLRDVAKDGYAETFFASISMVTSTVSPTTKPPVSSATFHLSPKSLRLIWFSP